MNHLIRSVFDSFSLGLVKVGDGKMKIKQSSLHFYFITDVLLITMTREWLSRATIHALKPSTAYLFQIPYHKHSSHTYLFLERQILHKRTYSLNLVTVRLLVIVTFGGEIRYPTSYFMEPNKTCADFVQHWDNAKEYTKPFGAKQLSHIKRT